MDDADSNLTSSTSAAPEIALDFRRAFARQWRESVRYFGFWRALRELAAACWRAMLELLPARRKARFGDLDYDWEHEVDTTRSNVGLRAQLLAELAGGPYFASDPWLFEQMMQQLALSIQPSAPSSQTSAAVPETSAPPGLKDFTFIDLGSGKGRALLMAAQYRFKKIIGVEFMPEWHKVAQENIRKFGEANPSVPPIESVCMDARDFEFPAEPLVVYLFNSFPEPVFAGVMERLRRSVLANPRPVLVAYRYIEFEDLLQQCDWLEKIAGTEQWTVFRNRRDRT